MLVSKFYIFHEIKPDSKRKKIAKPLKNPFLKVKF